MNEPSGSAAGERREAAPPEPNGGEEAGGAPAPSAARELCLWLAAQAANDRGLVGRLVRTHGSFAQVMALPRWTLALAVRKQAGADDPSLPAGLDPEPAPGRAQGDEAVVTWVDADYPPGLRELFDPPPALFVRGRHWQAMLRALRKRPTVAIVGARHPSPYGLEMAWLLGSGLARAGVNVVSGMALGIDAQAHVGALDGLGRLPADVALPGPARRDQTGVTPPDRACPDQTDAAPGGLPVALAGVLGSGARLSVPRTNDRLFADVARRGVLLSEYGWLLPPTPAVSRAQPPDRRSGRRGRHRRRPRDERRPAHRGLRARPGARRLGRARRGLGRPLSAGPHRLLRDGAHLCESPGDVIALLPGTTPAPGSQASGAAAPGPEGAAPTGPQGRVLAALRRGQHTADQLERGLGLAPQQVAAALAMLEIDGLLDVLPGGRYRLRRRPRPAAGP